MKVKAHKVLILTVKRMKFSSLKITLRKIKVSLSNRLKSYLNSRENWCKKFTRIIKWFTSQHTLLLIVKDFNSLPINTAAIYHSSKTITPSHVRTSPNTSYGKFASRKSNNISKKLSMWKSMKLIEDSECTTAPKSIDVFYILSYTDANERFIYFCQFNSEVYVHSDAYS